MPTTTGYEFERGNHPFELYAGHYVVVGAYSTYEAAERYTKRLFTNGYPDARFGFVSQKGLFYVTLFSTQDVSEARRVRDQTRTIQRDQFPSAWVLTMVER